MTNQHRATPEQWVRLDKWSTEDISLRTVGAFSCLLELRARIEALEAAQQPNSSASLTSSPADSLIDRVAQALYDAGHPIYPSTHGGWHTGARAAILEVAAWLRGRNTRVAASVQIAGDIEKEVNQ
jgi:hypothetical protein